MPPKYSASALLSETERCIFENQWKTQPSKKSSFRCVRNRYSLHDWIEHVWTPLPWLGWLEGSWRASSWMAELEGRWLELRTK